MKGLITIRFTQIKFASLILKDKCSGCAELTQPAKLSQLTKLLVFLILNFSFLINSHTQTRDQWLKQLTDSSFHGRGYVHYGDKIAADYLEKEFKKLGAAPAKKKYRQYFSHDVNTFPDSMRVTINGKTFIPGVDFIVDDLSGSDFKKYDTVVIVHHPEDSVAHFSAYTRGNAILIWDIHDIGPDEKEKHKFISDLKKRALYYTNLIGPMIIVGKEKLTWSVGDTCIRFPLIYFSHDRFPKDSATTVSLGIRNKMMYKYESSNVMGIIKAKKKSKKKKYLVYSAHYDHLGRMGDKTYFPGANDNASGTTMLLCLMEHYKNNPPEDYNVLFIAFGGEEAGLLGSKAYVQDPLIPLDKIAFVMNMDIMGTGDEGITVVNATKHTKEFELLEKINTEKNYLVKIKKRGETANSDHYWFDKNGVKSFFIYTMGGIQAYHDVFDKYETLPLTEFEDIRKMLIEFGDLYLKKN